jgi:release factor glutamine methyltransferase
MPLPELDSLPRTEAQLLLAHALGRSRAWVLAHPEAGLSAGQQAWLEQALIQQQAGVPLPYILGHWEFYGLDFTLTPEVLIPRPETELLVETALAWLKTHPRVHSAVEVGTGSGCIAVALTVHAPLLHLTATDCSPAALRVAQQNAQAHGVSGRISFQQADLLEGAPTPIHLLLANLPYIPTETLHTLPVYGREPTLALDGGAQGLDLIARLLEQARTRLGEGGLALLEIEAGQGEAVLDLARRAFPAALCSVLPDLAGLDRLLVIQNGD